MVRVRLNPELSEPSAAPSTAGLAGKHQSRIQVSALISMRIKTPVDPSGAQKALFSPRRDDLDGD